MQRRVSNHLRKKQLPLAERELGDEDSSRTDRLERIPAPEADPIGQVWEEEWAKNLADVAIERVKQKVAIKHFQMFDLYVLKNWPVREVARSLHTNIGSVYLAKHRITALIRQETEKLRKRMEAGG